MDVKLKCKAMTNVDSLAFTDFVNGPLYLFFCNEDGVILDNVVPLASSYKDDAKLKEALKKGEEVTISFVGMISNNLPKVLGASPLVMMWMGETLIWPTNFATIATPLRWSRWRNGTN